MNGLQLDLALCADEAFSLTVKCHIPERGVTAVYGPSGSGKTTLLNCIAGLVSADPGSVVRFRDEIWQGPGCFRPPWERDIGVVFQDARLFPHLSVRENLEYALHRRRRHDDSIDLETACQWLDLQALLNRPAPELSAGQKQRVAIARALLTAPRLLLLDEPLANLDKAARQQCLRYLQQLRDSIDLPMVYVSHDMEEVSQMADNLLLLEHGKVVGEGSLLELCSRLDTGLSHEEQAASIVLGTVTGHDSRFGLTAIAVEGQIFQVNHLNQDIGTRCRLRIPARDISVCRERASDSSILNILPITLAEIEQTEANRVLLRLALGEQYLLARITRKSLEELELKTGDRLFAQIKSVALLIEALENEA